jgi:hypothetical protein
MDTRDFYQVDAVVTPRGKLLSDLESHTLEGLTYYKVANVVLTGVHNDRIYESACQAYGPGLLTLGGSGAPLPPLTGPLLPPPSLTIATRSSLHLHAMP